MTAFRLVTFGGLAVERSDGAPASVGSQRKALALLAVLAVAGPTGVSRDRLAALLWPESNAERARGALNQMLHALRRQLGAAEAVRGSATLSLDDAHIESDVTRFRRALDAGDLESAVDVYAGAFLDGVHIDGADELSRWMDAERRAFAERYGAALEQLARAADANGEGVAAVSRWRRAQAADPLNSRIAMALMRALDAAGDRAGALTHARIHQALLAQELGVSPDPEVAALGLRLSQHDAGALPPAAGAREAVPMPALQGVLEDAPVESAESPTASPNTLPTRADRSPVVATESATHRNDLPWALGVGFTLFVAVAVAVFVMDRRERSTLRTERPDARATVRPPAGGRRVAVSVLANRTGDHRLDALGLIASDFITRGLISSPLVEVIEVGALYAQGRSPSGVPTDPATLAARTGASLVVDGSYFRTRDSVWFSVQVLDVASGRVLRTLDPIGSSVSDPLAAVDELRQRVATGLATILDPRVSPLIPPATRPPRYEAYQEYVLAQGLYWRGAFDAATPHFRRAVALDPDFLVAAVWLAGNAVSVGRCDVADSVVRAFDRKLDELGQWERLTLRVQRARCDSDWDEHNRLLRARIAFQPSSGFNMWALGNGSRQLNRPREALATLRSLDPDRDLAWLSDSGKVLYWREVSSDLHALGDFTAEAEAGARMDRDGHGRLAALYVQARARAGAGSGREAVALLADAGALDPEPGLVAAFTSGRMRATRLATPAWALHRVGLELQSHGDAPNAHAAIEQAREWLDHRAVAGRPAPEQRFLLAQCLWALGDFGRSRHLLEQLVREDPEDAQLAGALGVVAALQGDTVAARRMDRTLAAAPAHYPVGGPTLARAQIAAALGHPSVALDLLESLPHGAHPYDFELLHIDPAFASLRTEPRFQRLLRPRG
ncbi:MAG: BTAD domain-containing putative transcriptional regulator [bacterium]